MVRFGVAGYPPGFALSEFHSDRLAILNWLSNINLNAFEMQMTYGPRTKPQTCIELKQRANMFDINISIHAAYYIILTGSEKLKVDRSIDTLKRTFDLADILGSKKIVLHPGPLLGQKNEVCRSNLLKNIDKFFSSIGNTDIGLFLETSGKVGQYGSVEEVLEISYLIKQCFPCVDFGHVHARTLGTLKNNTSIDRVFDCIIKYLSERQDAQLHFHYTPIDFGNRGEIVHKSLEDVYPIDNQLSLGKDFDAFNGKVGLYQPRYERIIENINKLNIDCTIISETHNSQEKGALAMLNYYRKL